MIDFSEITINISTKVRQFFRQCEKVNYNVLENEDKTEVSVLPQERHTKYSSWRFIICLILFLILLVAFLTIYVLVPVLFMISIEFERLLMFTNIGLPTDPSNFALNFTGIRNMYLNFNNTRGENVTLGVWHILPKIIANSTTDFDDALANSGFDVVIHFHGSGETRMDSRGTFGLLWNFFHIIAFDYRDFADSSHAQLDEFGIARDSVKLYEWVRSKTKRNVYIWAHSLGTSLATLTVSHLKHVGLVPRGLILEAPFTTMREEIPHHPYGKIFSWLPWFNATILDPLERHGFIFNSSGYILHVDCPIMILHAIDDSIIPYTLGRKLAQIAKDDRNSSQGQVFYHQLPRGYDHFRIYKCPKVKFYIIKFIAACDIFAKT